MLQISFKPKRLPISRSDVIAVFYGHFYHYGTTWSQKIQGFFTSYINKSTMGKSNVWFNGVISLSKMFSHGKLTPHGLKLNNFAKSLILMSLIKIIN